MLPLSILLLLSATVRALVTVEDPSDVISPEQWAADNALLADYDVSLPESQPMDLVATHIIDGKSRKVDHVSWYAKGNDTDVVLVANDADFAASYSTFTKSGYYSNLYWSSFYGFNAAINVANASTAVLDHVNVTVHNGAANVYAYGTDTVVNVTDSWLYSSGPLSHGLYASGNGTIYASNVEHYSGGMRSSSFSGDSPAGYIYVEDSVAHVSGIGSATYYALGEIHANNVVSTSENGPVVFSDGTQKVYIKNCQAEAGLLAGTVMFSSSDRLSGAVLDLQHTKITTTGEDMPGLWFGNVIAEATLRNVELDTASGIIVAANFSQVTQDFSYFAGYVDNPSMSPAEVQLAVFESDLEGDLVAYNQSSIAISLQDYSTWEGTARVGYDTASFGVTLDSSSQWSLTADTTLQNFTNCDRSNGNIRSHGHNIYYNSTSDANSWLNGSTRKLPGGGKLQPQGR